MAAAAGIFMVTQMVGHGVPVIHFIDSTVALNIVLKGSAKQTDLNAICGHLWLQVAELRALCYAE